MGEKNRTIIVAVALTVVVVVLFWYLSQRLDTKPWPAPTPQAAEAGWQTTTFDTKLTIQHPKDYSVEQKPYNAAKILTLEKQGKNWKLAVFKKIDFKDSRPTWLFPEFKEGPEEYLPLDYTEELSVGGDDGYTVWMFYDKTDAAGKNELNKIFETIRYN